MAVEESPALSDAVSRYLATLSAEERQRAQPELLRFVRWYGGDVPVNQLQGHQVETYVESLGSNLIEANRRLEPLRSFFAYARKTGWTRSNLSVHLRLKRPGKATEPVARPVQGAQLTPEGHAALQAELETLKAQRPRIAEQLRLARADKDFRENAPLDAARDAQAHLEARIREIESLLHHATVITTNHAEEAHATVQLGSTVVVRNLGSGAEFRYTLVSPSEAAPSEGKLSAASPIGRALLERTAGEEVEVQVPAGVMHLRIEHIERPT